MGGYLISSSGKIVAIDDDKRYEEYLNKPDFKKATKKQVEKWRQEKVNLIQKTETAKKEKIRREVEGVELQSDGIYFATTTKDGKDGYGTAGKAIEKRLIELGIPVSRRNTGQKVALVFHHPYSLMYINSPIKILYTMFESSRIPDSWKEYLELADLILVPSKFCQKVFKEAGFDAKVVPLGYDESMFHYQERKVPIDNNQDFVFCHYNAYNMRKGFLEVVNAFQEEFKSTEPVKLILKTTHKNPPLTFSKLKYPNIKVIKGSWPADKLNELLGESHCFLFPSRGEGFGMTPLEAMATGIPAIVPNAHGITEYFDPRYMIEVEVEEEKSPPIYVRYKDENVGYMVKCSVKDLRKKMRYAYQHQKETLEMGKRASKWALKNYTYNNTASILAEIYREWNQKEITKKPIKEVLPLEPV